MSPPNPFVAERCIGTVIEVNPTYVRANLPNAASPDGQSHHGYRLGMGEVGEFVVIECGDVAIFARITVVRLPERERLTVDPSSSATLSPAHPLGNLQLLATLVLTEQRVVGGISQYPRLGSRVYSAHPNLVAWVAESTDVRGDAGLCFTIATVADAASASVRVSPERLFGRHCAILGATGGGKSWTVARLVEEIGRIGGKAILLDPTGEFRQLGEAIHVHVGSKDSKRSRAVAVPYTEMVEDDLFALFTPSVQSQLPKLRSAIKSLKLVKKKPALSEGGLVKKANRSKAAFNEAYREHSIAIDSAAADFDIEYLAAQISEECVFADAKSGMNIDVTKWGGYSDSDRNYCLTLVARVENLLSTSALAPILRPGNRRSLFDEIDEFVFSSDAHVLVVSLRDVAFQNHVREIAVNAIGRRVLERAREGFLRDRPVVLFLDEAHQFLNRALGDEFTKYRLDAFELIAKEGRKFGLTVCLATQRSRDLPEGVLSQMGALIVHRLTNALDREIVERASGDIDRSAAAFLPTLAPGQAILIGAGNSIPLTLQVLPPRVKPDSSGPNYQKHWQKDAEAAGEGK